MTVRVCRRPFTDPWQRALRLQGVGLMSLGVGVLAVWNPLTHPGPIVCLLRHAVGLPCPLCGMTRGVALSLRGHPLDASLYNPLTVPVLAAALVLAVKWSVEYVTRRQIDVVMPPRLYRSLLLGVQLVFLASWAYLLLFRREDPFAACWLGRLLHTLSF
jgi:Protein of unknown function (DUF2752)